MQGRNKRCIEKCLTQISLSHRIHDNKGDKHKNTGISACVHLLEFIATSTHQICLGDIGDAIVSLLSVVAMVTVAMMAMMAMIDDGDDR